MLASPRNSLEDDRKRVALAGGDVRVGWLVPLTGIGSLEIRARDVPPDAPVALPSIGCVLMHSVETEGELDRLVEDHIANTDQLVALYHIIAATRESWELADKLDVMLEQAGRQLGTSLAFLEVSGEGQDHFAVWPGDERLRRERAGRLLTRCAHEPDSFIAEDPEPFVAAPILLRNQIVGWLGAGARRTGDDLGQRDLKHVSALAELAAGFLQTAQLQDQVVANTKLQREVEIASQIQSMLMPRRVPHGKTLGVAASCQPASSVGGDFFVVQELEDGRFAFALGDVAGKGVPAALVMAMARTAFRSLTPLSGGPERVLERLSQVLYDDLEVVGRFVTLVLGFHDPETARIEIANAGHSPVLYRPDAESRFALLEPPLPPLGVTAEMGADPLRLAFGPGAALVACSDGVPEARDPKGGFYGNERLRQILDAQGPSGADGLRTAVLRDVALFAQGAPQADDQTILVLVHAVDPCSGERSRVTQGERTAFCNPGTDPSEFRSNFTLIPRPPSLAILNREFDRVLEQVRAQVRDRGKLAAIDASHEEIKLALHEAVANLIEHGEVPDGESIEVRLEGNADGFEAELVSSGLTFDPGRIRAEPPAPEALKEGGYGLYLLRSLVDGIDYDPGEGRHTLRLTRRWSRP